MTTTILLALAVHVGLWSQVTADSPTISEIVQGAKAREAAIRNFHVKADFKQKSRSRYTGKYLDSATSMKVIIDFRSGRFWYHKLAQMYNSPGGELHNGQEFFSEIEEVMAFDGEKTRQLTLSRDEKDPEVAKISRVGTIFPGVREYWLTDPRDFVCNFMRDSISVLIGLGTPTSLGTSPDGLVGFENVNPTAGPDGSRRAVRFWFDVKKGMIVPRREARILRPGDSEWVPYFISRLDDLFEISPGLWLPRKYTEEFYQVLPDQAPFLVWKRGVAVSEWAINQDLQDSQFAIAFPAGTLVNNQELGRHYRTRVVDDRTIARMAKAA
ncbi:MAG: hypothetical protein ACP5XB_19465 [Isosphaeraceae bacterium]